jgi:cytoskeletal protein RodZ
MPEHPTNTPSPLEIDWLKTCAGALAAVTTAVLLSTLGAAGTLIGAAVGSIAATVGSAVYAQGLARSKHAVLKAQTTALHKVGVAQAEVRRAARHEGAVQEAHLDLADERLAEAKDELDAPALGSRTRLAALNWRRIGVVAVGTFAAVVLAVTAFEAVAGRSVSSLTGGSGSDQGSTLGGVSGGSGGKTRHHQQQSPTESPSETPTQQPSESPSATPTATPTEASTPTPTPTGTPTETPSATETPSGAPTPTATP